MRGIVCIQVFRISEDFIFYVFSFFRRFIVYVHLSLYLRIVYLFCAVFWLQRLFVNTVEPHLTYFGTGLSFFSSLFWPWEKSAQLYKMRSAKKHWCSERLHAPSSRSFHHSHRSSTTNGFQWKEQEILLLFIFRHLNAYNLLQKYY